MNNINFLEGVISAHPRNPSFWFYYSPDHKWTASRCRFQANNNLVDCFTGYNMEIAHSYVDIVLSSQMLFGVNSVSRCGGYQQHSFTLHNTTLLRDPD
jgi:hypothetical protein